MLRARVGAWLMISAAGCDGPPAATPSAAPPDSPPATNSPATSIPATSRPGPVTAATLRMRLQLAGWPGALAWSPDGGRLASGDEDGAVRIWDARTGLPITDLLRQQRRVSALAYAPDGGRVAVAALADLRVWDAQTGAPQHTLPGHGDIVTDLCFVGDDLYAVDLRDELRRWDPRSGRLVATTPVPTIHKLSTAIAPDGATLALGGYGDLELFDLAAAKPRFTLTTPDCAKAPDDLLCAHWRDVEIEEFGASPGEPRSRYKDRRPNWYVQSLAFSADGALLAAGRADGVALVVDVATGKPLARFATGAEDGAIVALSPDGAVLALADRDGRLALWNISEKKEVKLLHEPGQRCGPLAFTADGRTLAAGGPGTRVTIWDLAH